MEVLDRVDVDRIVALRARDEFFWLDLHDPSPEDLDTLAELLGLPPLAVQDAVSSASARRSTPTATACSSCSTAPTTGLRTPS